MSFVVIWDTCTKPAYYADLHKVMALPEGMVVRYDYRKKYFDPMSLDCFVRLSKNEIAEVSVILFYGEVDGYSKGSGDQPSGSVASHHVPFRLGTVIRAVISSGSDDANNDKVVYDIKLGKYPNVDKFDRLRTQMLPVFQQRGPFSKWHTFFAEDSFRSELFTDNAYESRNNWERAVELLQKRQFKDDSFWSVEGPFDNLGKSISGRISQMETPNGLVNSVIEINDEEDLFFVINNREPLVDNKQFAKPREVKISSTGAVTVDETTILLRPYSSLSLQVRGSTTSYWKGDIGGIELETKSSDSELLAPFGPQFLLRFRVNKKRWMIYIGLMLGVFSAGGFATAAKLSIYVNVAGAAPRLDLNTLLAVVGLTVVSSVVLVLASVLLRKEIKF